MTRHDRDKQLLYWLKRQWDTGIQGHEFVQDYDSLPLSPSSKIYVVLNSQGTWWLPGGLGGVYKPKGLYKYITGAWLYLGESPAAATLDQATEGTETSSFISPKTLNDWRDVYFIVSDTEPSSPNPGAIWIDIS